MAGVGGVILGLFIRRAFVWVALLAALMAALPMPSLAELSLPYRISDAERSVVRVVVLLYDQDDQYVAASVGTGFVVAPHRVLTNNHVIEGEGAGQIGRREILIVPDPASGRRSVPAQIIRASVDPDLALLAVPELRAPPMRFAGVYPEHDAVIHALGYPGVTDRILNRTPQEMMAPSEPTVTAGSIALLSRRGPGGTNTPTIFHTAFINPGNSGGPLIDACGRIIGINTWSGTATVSEQGVSVPQGQFIAIQSTALSTFLRASGVRNRPEQDACVPPIDPRIQRIVDAQQMELRQLREERAAEREENRRNAASQRNLIIVGIILIGGGAGAVLFIRRRRPAPAPPVDVPRNPNG